MTDQFRNITFPPENDGFFAELREEVNAYFKKSGKSIYGNTSMYLKIACLFVVYVFVFSIPFIFPVEPSHIFLCYSFLGIWGVFLGVNVGHDAAHNSLFKTKKYNQWFMYIFDFLGLSSFNWKNRHVSGHHIYSNIMEYDPDIQQSAVVKIFPQDKTRSFHKFQWIYMPLIYAIFIPRWVFYRDFKDIFFTRIGGFYNRPYPILEIVKMLAFKVFYIFYMVIVPYWFTEQTILVFIASFLLLMVCSSLTIIVILLTTHMLEDSHFPDPDENGLMPYSWSKHQVLTTSDYATDSGIITHLFGGFNHHVIHHLFQHICHIHYPELTLILKKVAKKYNVQYQSRKYILPAMYSHFKLLYNNGLNIKQRPLVK